MCHTGTFLSSCTRFSPFLTSEPRLHIWSFSCVTCCAVYNKIAVGLLLWRSVFDLAQNYYCCLFMSIYCHLGLLYNTAEHFPKFIIVFGDFSVISIHSAVEMKRAHTWIPHNLLFNIDHSTVKLIWHVSITSIGRGEGSVFGNFSKMRVNPPEVM